MPRIPSGAKVAAGDRRPRAKTKQPAAPIDKKAHLGMGLTSLRGRGIWSQLRNPDHHPAKLLADLFAGMMADSASDASRTRLFMVVTPTLFAWPKRCNRLRSRRSTAASLRPDHGPQLPKQTDVTEVKR